MKTLTFVQIDDQFKTAQELFDIYYWKNTPSLFEEELVKECEYIMSEYAKYESGARSHRQADIDASW